MVVEAIAIAGGQHAHNDDEGDTHDDDAEKHHDGLTVVALEIKEIFEVKHIVFALKGE